MAAKSNKIAAKKGTAKKSAPIVIRRPAKENAAEVEVVSDVPDLMSPGVVKQVLQVQDFVANSQQLKDSELARGISAFSKKASGFALDAVKAGASALVYAWACGKLLNATKAKVGHGKFGAWREKNLDAVVISERTSQRYMQLAKQCDDVKALLEWSPSLRQAYIACGILPEPPERDLDETGDSDEAKREALLSSITGVQKKLRLFAGLTGGLSVAEKTQLKLAKKEIDLFFKQILG